MEEVLGEEGTLSDGFSFFLGITLVSLVVPVASGVYVNYRWPKQATVILKVRSPSHAQHIIKYRD